jgi:hypothetical protein
MPATYKQERRSRSAAWFRRLRAASSPLAPPPLLTQSNPSWIRPLFSLIPPSRSKPPLSTVSLIIQLESNQRLDVPSTLLFRRISLPPMLLLPFTLFPHILPIRNRSRPWRTSPSLRLSLQPRPLSLSFPPAGASAAFSSHTVVSLSRLNNASRVASPSLPSDLLLLDNHRLPASSPVSPSPVSASLLPNPSPPRFQTSSLSSLQLRRPPTP